MAPRHILRRLPEALASAVLLLAMALAAPAARALTEAEVGAKLDTILMLMVVDDKGQPRALKLNVDGRSLNAYLGAMSISAADAITAGKSYGLSPQEAAALRFAPVSLARFNMLLEPLLKAEPQDVGVIAPDPDQIPAAEKLLIAQKVAPDEARRIAALQPMVFCPEPGLLVSFNEGPDKSKSFVPCSTEAAFVEGIVQRSIKESTKIASLKPRVLAIPLNGFIAFLRKEPEAKVGQLRVLSSGRMVTLIQEITRQRSAPAVQPAAPSTRQP